MKIPTSLLAKQYQPTRRLIEINISTGERQLRVDNLPQNISDMDYDAVNHRLLILSQHTGGHSIDLSNNTISPFFNDCLVTFKLPQFADYNSDKNTLLLGTWVLVEYDFASGKCTEYPGTLLEDVRTDGHYISSDAVLLLHNDGISEMDLNTSRHYFISN